MSQDDQGHRSLGRRTTVKGQGDEQMGEREQTAQKDHMLKPRGNAGLVVIQVTSVFVSHR